MKKKFTIKDIKNHFVKSDRPLYMETTDRYMRTKARIMFNDGTSIYSLDYDYGYFDSDYSMVSCFCLKDFTNTPCKYNLNSVLKDLNDYNYDKGITYIESL
jgi:hypothetical protein